MKMIDHNHFICHLILGTFTEYPSLYTSKSRHISFEMPACFLKICTKTKIFCTKDSASMPVLSELILILFEIFARRNTKLLLEAF